MCRKSKRKLCKLLDWQNLVIKSFLLISFGAMLSQLVLFQKYFEFFPLKKDRCCESYIARIFQWLSYLDTFTETSKAPDEAVAAVNLGEQGPNSVSESVSYPEATTIQQIVGDTVSSGRENGKKSREPRISETIIIYWMMVRVQALLCCFPCTELKLSQLHVITPPRNSVNIPAFLHFKVSWWAVLHFWKADCSMSNSGMRHGNEY